MSETSLTDATAARLQSSARELSHQSEELSAISKRVGASLRTAIEELPKQAETARAAVRAFLSGIRADSRNRG